MEVTWWVIGGEGEERLCMTHGHELRRGLMEGGGVPWRGRQNGKIWDNCNTIINKIY